MEEEDEFEGDVTACGFSEQTLVNLLPLLFPFYSLWQEMDIDDILLFLSPPHSLPPRVCLFVIGAPLSHTNTSCRHFEHRHHQLE